MPDMVRLAMERNLANAERLGDKDRAKRIKARLNELVKAEKKAEKAEAPVEKVAEKAAPAKKEE